MVIDATSTRRLMTIASSGHASSHRPQNMQRSMAMSKTFGRRWMPSPTSSGKIVMQSVGHAFSHSPHATQRSAPFSICTSTGMPRKAGE